MEVPFVDLKAQFSNIANEIEEAIQRVLKKCQFILGEEVERFESDFASFLRCEYAVGVSNGLDALRLGLEAAGIGEGDEVILPANTYIASALAISSVKARPVLVDINPQSYHIDPRLIDKAVTPLTRAIMPVHLYGQCVDMNSVLEIARRHQLFVIEDACQSHGARYHEKRAGTLGDLGCFSFYPGKNLGAYGDGGAVVTNDRKLADKIRRLRNYGQRSKYDHQEKGWNARLDEMQAAVLNVKLKYLDEWNQLRAKHASSYSENLKTNEHIQIPEIFSDRDHVFHLYVIRAKNRNELQRFLREKKIATQIHYPLPVHLEKAYRDLGYKAGDFPKNGARGERDIIASYVSRIAINSAELCHRIDPELLLTVAYP